MSSLPQPDATGAISASQALVARAASALVDAITAAGRTEVLMDEARLFRVESRELRRAARDGRERTRADVLPALRESLRDGVRHYAVTLRDAGTPPERMLRQVKEAVEPAMRGGRPDDRVERLSEDVVRWSLDAYFAA